MKLILKDERQQIYLELNILFDKIVLFVNFLIEPLPSDVFQNFDQGHLNTVFMSE